ncbi:unnamed protein product [Cylicocyclus nassatus]|uniref:Kinesin motor domain-containing protein n=1 Tax=Cylicocyclus nassatus TaxID=53992 RepID=A0AA36DSW2_CYLNA|nr:unnamed protein product [Cylicocyclus nassatus]
MTQQEINNRFTVCVRKRPLSESEKSRKEAEVVAIPSHNCVIVEQPRIKLDLTKHVKMHKFQFDHIFDEIASNETVYKSTAQPLVKTIFKQGFAACFACGQRGSGKTYTMSGDLTNGNQNYASSMYAMSASDVLEMQDSEDYKNLGLTVSCSFYEIYGEKNGRKKVQLVGLEEVPIHCKDDVLHLLKQGTEMRAVESNSAHQSRNSHAVFQIILKRNRKLWGKFSLIDLASDSRDDLAKSDRQTQMKESEVCESLFALKECLRAMASNSQYVPFRASKLTLLLRDLLLKPNARICMIATVNPGISSCKQTINNLRFANGVREFAKEGENSGPTNEMLVSVLAAAKNDALFSCYLFDKSMTYWVEKNRSICSKNMDDDGIDQVINLISSMSSDLSRYLGQLKKWQELKAAVKMSKKTAPYW